MAQHPDLRWRDCPATLEGLTCALGEGHETDWHWDQRGVDWRSNPGVPALLGAVTTANRHTEG